MFQKILKIISTYSISTVEFVKNGSCPELDWVALNWTVRNGPLILEWIDVTRWTGVEVPWCLFVGDACPRSRSGKFGFWNDLRLKFGDACPPNKSKKSRIDAVSGSF